MAAIAECSTIVMSILQPNLRFDEINDLPETIDSPEILHALRQLVGFWATNVFHHRLPDFFDEEFEITRVIRQPLFFVSISTQVARRSAEQVEVPYDGKPIDTSPWPDLDLFRLLPLQKVDFSDETITRRDPVGGCQTIVPCGSCQTSGEIPCPNCTGSGGNLCENCEGAGQEICARCEGAGSLVGRNIDLEECIFCRGTGEVECVACTGAGHLTCANCTGRGSVNCGSCEGQGQLKQSWIVVTATSTHHCHSLLQAESFPDSAKALADDTHQILGGEFDLTAEVSWQRQLADLLPKEVSWLVTEMAKDAITDAESGSSVQSRASQLRVGIRGTYLYRLELEQGGQPATLYVGGLSNHIYPETLPKRSQGVVVRIQRAIDSFFSAFGMGARSRPDANLAAAVSGEQIHVADTDQLAKDLRKLDLTLHHRPYGVRCQG